MAGPIVISILANANKAQQSFNKTSSAASKMGAGIRKAAVPAAAALVGLGKAAFDATKAAAEDAASQQRLAQSLKTGAGATAAQIAATEKYIEAQGKLFGTTDDELRPAIAKLAQATGSTTKAMKLASLAQNISASTGKSLEAVSKKLAKAQTNGAASLAEYGVQTKDAEGKTRNLGSVLKDLGSKYKGAAASGAKTAAGQQKILSVQMGEFQESLGAVLLPILTKVTKAGLKVVGWLQKNTGVAKLLVGVLAALAAGIIAVNIAMSLNPAALVVIGLVALGAALVVAYKKSETFRNIVNSIGDFIRNKVVPALKQFAAFVVNTVIPAVVATAKQIGAKLKPILEQLAATFKAKILPTIIKVVAKFKEMWPTIQKVIAFVIKLYGQYLKFVATVAGKVIPVIIKFVGFVISKVVPAIADFIGIVVDIVKKIIDFGKKVKEAGEKVATFVRGAVEKFQTFMTKVGEVKDKVQTAFDAIKSVVDSVGQGIKDAIEAVTGKIGDLLEKLGKLKDLAGDALSVLPGLRTTASVSVASHFGSFTGFQPIAIEARTAAPLRIEIKLSAHEIDQLSRGKSILADIDAYKRAGGRSVAA